MTGFFLRTSGCGDKSGGLVHHKCGKDNETVTKHSEIYSMYVPFYAEYEDVKTAGTDKESSTSQVKFMWLAQQAI